MLIMKSLLPFIIFAFLISCNTEKLSDHTDTVTNMFPDIHISERTNVYVDPNGNLLHQTVSSEYEDGSQKARLTFENGLITEGMVWHENGRLLTSYTAKDSLIVQTFYNGKEVKIAESYFKDNVVQPVAMNTWNEDGTPNTQYDFERSVLQVWHDNGQLASEAPMINGRIHGTVYGWHKNGELAAENHFTDDQQHGSFKKWDDRGNLIEERTYNMGMPHGTHRKWNTDGRLIEEIIYEDGEPLAIKRD